MAKINKPESKISPKAIQVYRLSHLLTFFILLLFLGTFIWFAYFFEWNLWIKRISVLLVIIFPFIGGAITVYQPKFFQRYFRYGVDQHFIRLQSGRFHQVDTVIPMTKVQYVEAEQGPFLRKFKLYTLTVGTINSAHQIPALPEEKAMHVRDLIAFHAKIAEVDKL